MDNEDIRSVGRDLGNECIDFGNDSINAYVRLAMQCLSQRTRHSLRFVNDHDSDRHLLYTVGSS